MVQTKIQQTEQAIEQLNKTSEENIDQAQVLLRDYFVVSISDYDHDWAEVGSFVPKIVKAAVALAKAEILEEFGSILKPEERPPCEFDHD